MTEAVVGGDCNAMCYYKERAFQQAPVKLFQRFLPQEGHSRIFVSGTSYNKISGYMLLGPIDECHENTGHCNGRYILCRGSTPEAFKTQAHGDA